MRIKDRLKTDEVFKIYSKWVFKGVECRRRIPIRFEWDHPQRILCLVFKDISTGEVFRHWIDGQSNPALL